MENEKWKNGIIQFGVAAFVVSFLSRLVFAVSLLRSQFPRVAAKQGSGFVLTGWFWILLLSSVVAPLGNIVRSTPPKQLFPFSLYNLVHLTYIATTSFSFVLLLLALPPRAFGFDIALYLVFPTLLTREFGNQVHTQRGEASTIRKNFNFDLIHKMSEVQAPVQKNPIAVDPATVEPVTITAPEASVDPVRPLATDSLTAASRSEVTPAADAATETPVGESKGENLAKNEEVVEAQPINEGILGYKAPGLVKYAQLS